MKIKKETIERVIELLQDYKDAYMKFAKTENSLDMVRLDQYNPLKDEAFNFINSLPKDEKRDLLVLLKFGRPYIPTSKDDFEHINKSTHSFKDYDIDSMIGNNFSTDYLMKALYKLKEIGLDIISN
jgi:hypothetical protein